MSQGVRGWPLILLVNLAVLLLRAATLSHQAAVVGLFGITLGHIAVRLIYQRRLGGYTGDCLGDVQQVSEVVYILGIVSILM